MKQSILLVFLLTNFGLMTSGYAGTSQIPPHTSGSPHPQVVRDSQPIHLNSIDAKTLVHNKVKGIGPSRAKAIVAYRDAHGRFKSIAELTQVPGISQHTLEKYQDIWKKKFTVDKSPSR